MTETRTTVLFVIQAANTDESWHDYSTSRVWANVDLGKAKKDMKELIRDLKGTRLLSMIPNFRIIQRIQTVTDLPI